jgi:translation elongation factor EF-1alpha
MHLHTLTCEVSIEKIVSVLDKKTGKPIKGQMFARKGSAVIVNITTSLPVAVERFEDYNALSRILLRDEDLTIAVGKVIKLAKEGKEKK